MAVEQAVKEVNLRISSISSTITTRVCMNTLVLSIHLFTHQFINYSFFQFIIHPFIQSFSNMSTHHNSSLSSSSSLLHFPPLLSSFLLFFIFLSFSSPSPSPSPLLLFFFISSPFHPFSSPFPLFHIFSSSFPLLIFPPCPTPRVRGVGGGVSGRGPPSLLSPHGRCGPFLVHCPGAGGDTAVALLDTRGHCGWGDVMT